MAGASEPVIPSSSAITREEICENATILDEGIRVCPLCRSEVRLFFTNFNEKILMCENIECEYPFGHEPPLYVKENNEIQWDEEVASIGRVTKSSPSASLSMISTTSWLEIDKINKMNAEDQFPEKLESKEYYNHKKEQATNEKEDKDEKDILKEVAVIKKLNVELLGTENKPHIRNQKWIKNLMSMQEMSGVTLLDPEEMKLVQKQQPEIGLGELKIDIDINNKHSMSSIKIEIASLKNSTLEGVDNTYTVID